MRFRLGTQIVVAAAILGVARWAAATDYYVAPTGGSDTNNGSFGLPFASITAGINAAQAGDTIYLRGGTFNLSTTIKLQNKSGTAAAPIRLWAYPGEHPILDFAGQTESSSSRGIQINNSANYWQMKGFTIQNAGDNGLYTEGDYGVFDQIVTRWNRDSGFQLHTTASYNLVQNCDSYENYDPETANPSSRGENADGFAVKSPTVGPGNIFRGDRSFRNADDGWDMFEARANGVMIDHCWSYDNAFDRDPTNPRPFQGDGNGFKLGHDSGSHYIVDSAAWDNPQNGFDINGNGYKYNGNTPTSPNGNTVHIFNSTAYNNGALNFRFDEDLPHVLRNNISLDGDVLMENKVAQQLNSWNNIPVDDEDMLSLDDAIVQGPRQADGSLPLSAFLRLRPGALAVDQGTPILYAFDGTPYNIPANGAAPDLGAFESGTSGQPGDFNGDFFVDAIDYAVWRDSYGRTGTGLLADANHDNVVNQADYLIWKSHFGLPPSGSGGGGSLGAGVEAPEPGSIVLGFLAIVGGGCIYSARHRRFHSN